MRRPSPYRNEQRFGVTMTPMIDVIFLLLVFFVATASFQAIEEVLPSHFTLPGSVTSQTQIDPEILDLDEIVIDVLWRAGRPRWEIAGRQYESLGDLQMVLVATRQVKADLPVILDVEAPVPMEHVIDVYDLCRAVGLERIQFAASGAS